MPCPSMCPKQVWSVKNGFGNIKGQGIRVFLSELIQNLQYKTQIYDI